MFELALLVVSITTQSSNVVLREIFYFSSESGWEHCMIYVCMDLKIRWEWGLGSISAGSPRSLSTSAFPSYSGLLRPVIIRVSCLSFSHVAMFFIPVVFTIFFCTPSSFVLSLFVFFYPRRSLFCFLNGVSSSFYNLSFGIVHLYVSRVTKLTRFSGIWHCALRGLILSFRYLSLVFPLFHSPFTPTFITIGVVRPPWGHEISCLLRHISFGQAPSTGWSTGCWPISISWGYRGIA